jgi:molecular chaperone HtpG
VLAKLKEALKDKADDVRVTTRLVDSPACLVVKDDGMSTQLARMLKQAGQAAPDVKPVLEINPEHALVKKLDASSISMTWPTSCSTRRCWPKAACPPTQRRM